MKLMIISLCTTGVMREHFISYASHFSKYEDVFCITNDNISIDDINCKEILNLRYKRKNKLGYFSILKLIKAKKFIKKIKPDCILIFTPHPVNILLANYIKKYKLIYQVHDPIPHSGTNFLDSFLLKIQHKIYYKYSSKLLVAGQKLKEEVIKTSKIDVSSKIRVIKFAVLDSNMYQIEKQEKNIDLLFFGRIEYYKGLDILFKVLENKSYICYIIGKGNIFDVYGKKIKIPKNISIINEYVPDEILAEYICKSKVVVLPYRDATGSMTIGISYYYGTPVIATDVGVFGEYVGNGGIIVPKEDHFALSENIDRLLSDDKMINTLSKNAKQMYTNEFSIDKIIDLNLKTFRE